MRACSTRLFKRAIRTSADHSSAVSEGIRRLVDTLNFTLTKFTSTLKTVLKSQDAQIVPDQKEAEKEAPLCEMRRRAVPAEGGATGRDQAAGRRGDAAAAARRRGAEGAAAAG